MDVISTPAQFGFKLIDWEFSPWVKEEYLGQMLTPDQVRGSSFRPTFFDIADLIVRAIPEVDGYFK